MIAVYTIIIVFAFLYWFNYGNSLNRLSYTLQPKDVKTWYLGIRYFQPEYYYLILKRLIYELSVPGVIIILIGIISLLRDKSRAYAKVLLLWIFNTVLYLVVFNNLNYIHNYYQLPIYPPLVITFVYGLVYSYSILRKKTIIFLITVYILLSTSFPKSYFFVKDNPYQDYISTITKVIQQCTNEEKKIIYVWPNADPDHPTVLYYARRLGYNFDLFKLEKIKEIIQYDQEVRSIVFFPVKKGTKEQISSILKKINLMIKEECYRNNTLVLELI